jgi:hypothetical protein
MLNIGNGKDAAAGAPTAETGVSVAKPSAPAICAPVEASGEAAGAEMPVAITAGILTTNWAVECAVVAAGSASVVVGTADSVTVDVAGGGIAARV